MERYLDVTRAEMLFSKGVILVEGAAEQFLIPAFAAAWLQKSNAADSLDELGISVCSVNGTDFGPFCRMLSPQGFAIPYVVVTDGDPTMTKEGKTWAGNVRGGRIIQDDEKRKEHEELIAASEFQESDEMLADNGIFVGRETLEIDLLGPLQKEIQETYAEFRRTKALVTKFSSLVESAVAAGEKVDELGDEDEAELTSNYNEIVARIERIGKGRFAQRLASKISNQSPPSYIERAIGQIVRLVTKQNA